MRRTLGTLVAGVGVTGVLVAGGTSAAADPVAPTDPPVAAVDVDGDGVVDEVFTSPTDDPDLIDVRVVTALGAELTRQVPVDSYRTDGAPDYRGATELDGEPGAELVFTSSLGAHTLWSTVLTVNSVGELVELPAPGNDELTGQWVVDSSMSSNVGVTADAPGVVTVRTASADADFANYDTSEQTWSFSDGVWVTSGPVRESTQPVDAPLPAGFAGWHAPGLPVH